MQVKRHLSPLHTLLSMHKLHQALMEKRVVAHADACSQPTYDTAIQDRQAAKAIHAPKNRELHIYTDGSGIDGKIGVAPVMRDRSGRWIALRYGLGTTGQHAVYEAELTGMILAVHIKDQAADYVKQSHRLSKIKRIDGTTPSDRYIKILRALRRNQGAALTQLRTIHIPLAYHLCRIQAADTAICSGCKWSNETVIHDLLHCPAYYERARRKLVNALGMSGRDMGYLLSHPKAISHTLQSIDDTGRFTHIYGRVSASPDQTKQLNDLTRPPANDKRHGKRSNDSHREQRR